MRVRELTRALAALGLAVEVLECFGLRSVDDHVAVVVLDGLPTSSTLRTMADATAQRPSLAILVIGPTQPELDALVALASGASGYLTAEASGDDVTAAVASLLAGEVVLPPPTSAALVRGLRCRGIPVCRDDGGTTVLTHREWEVLVLLRQARTTAEIAERFVVSHGTVRTHVATIVRKLGADGRASIAAAAG
jgi:DNA-binding NarL/FixJ family response regulator